MKIDPHRYKERYIVWKKTNKEIEGVSDKNSKLIVNYLNDMEMGFNVSSQKGARGYARLCNLKQRMGFIAKKLEELYNKKDITRSTEKEIVSFFNEMRNGSIKSRSGKNYISTADYVWVFKAFWHWYIKVSKKEGKIIEDITIDLDTSQVKEPTFVFLEDKEMRAFLNRCKWEHKVLGYFCYDSGIRSPTELMNVRVSDLIWDDKEKIYTLTIRDEVAKTFGRKIKLMFSSQELKNYIEQKNLSDDDVVFPINPLSVTKYYQRNVIKVFGKTAEKKTKGGEVFKRFSLYDFRHNSACYWIPRYKNESGLKYRFGWKKDNMIYYYTKMLGHKDTITKEDLFVDITKTELEQQLETEKKSRQLLQEQVTEMGSKIEMFDKVMPAIETFMASKEYKAFKKGIGFEK